MHLLFVSSAIVQKRIVNVALVPSSVERVSVVLVELSALPVSFRKVRIG